jgi:hypothetical protein
VKRGLSTGKPTKSEADRIVAAKEGPCVACFRLLVPAQYGNDYHHLKSGNIRRGHRYGIALCGWHHRGLTGENSHEYMRHALGPSLMDGSRLFHETYGSDDELLALQDELIGWTDE